MATNNWHVDPDSFEEKAILKALPNNKKDALARGMQWNVEPVTEPLTTYQAWDSVGPWLQFDDVMDAMEYCGYDTNAEVKPVRIWTVTEYPSGDTYIQRMTEEESKHMDQLEANAIHNSKATEGTGGRKDDHGKPAYELIPPEVLEAMSTVLEYGSRKYAPRNWEKGMSWGRVFGALMRHMWAWWRGENLDPETGFSHLWNASCCLAFLVAYEQRKIGEDDRPSRAA